MHPRTPGTSDIERSDECSDNKPHCHFRGPNDYGSGANNDSGGASDYICQDRPHPRYIQHSTGWTKDNISLCRNAVQCQGEFGVVGIVSSLSSPSSIQPCTR
jgi:hypothetical protein